MAVITKDDPPVAPNACRTWRLVIKEVSARRRRRSLFMSLPERIDQGPSHGAATLGQANATEGAVCP